MFASNLTPEEELNWLALKMVPGLGMRTAARLLERFRSPRAILTAARSELEASGIAGGVAQSVASGCAFDEAVLQQQKMRECGAELIALTDPRYPQPLREIFDPPFALFARGRVELLATLMLAVVGTRRPTPYGLAATERLSGDLARAGLTIVSGMARGIDTAAHRAALAAAGNTVAVLGCGVDLVYPSENRKLAGEIVDDQRQAGIQRVAGVTVGFDRGDNRTDKIRLPAKAGAQQTAKLGSDPFAFTLSLS